MKTNTNVCIGLLLLINCSCISHKELKSVFINDFYLGASINRDVAHGNDQKGQKVLIQHFNCISPENDLKWINIHPQPGFYNFKPADDYVNLGLANKMFIVGHTLIWHAQIPGWVFKDSNGNTITRDSLLARMEDHISTVVGRYKGKINGWDVVNEALNDDGSLRKSEWYNIIGEDYVEKAFEFAHKADPEAELYYNDYNLYKPQKREGAIRLIKRLQAKNIPVAAIGEQGHYGLSNPDISLIRKSINAFSQAGVKVNISELDINVLPNKERNTTADTSKKIEFESQLNPYTEGLPDSVLQKQANRYADLFSLFKEEWDKIDRVTFWGITDRDSWLNNWPIRGRTNYPLLFDRSYEAKNPVIDAILNVGK